jgi:hypothetical protein
MSSAVSAEQMGNHRPRLVPCCSGDWEFRKYLIVSSTYWLDVLSPLRNGDIPAVAAELIAGVPHSASRNCITPPAIGNIHVAACRLPYDFLEAAL